MINIADNPLVQAQIRSSTDKPRDDDVQPGLNESAGAGGKAPDPARKMELVSGRYYVVNEKK